MMNAQQPLVNPAPSQWHARLSLRFAKTRRGVRLVEKAHQGPLYIQKPFYPEGLDTPHAYVLHPPGGLVSGDKLHIDVRIDENAHALITTPGAGRLYKARHDLSLQKQSTTLSVAKGAAIEWLPLEAIFFPSANVKIDNEIHLASDAKCVFWDVMSLGLPANKARFTSGSINQNLKVYQQGRLALQERFVLDDRIRAVLDSPIGLQGFSIQGFLLAGPFSDQTDTLIDVLRSLFSESGERIGLSMVNGFMVIRGLGECSERMRHVFEKAWGLIRPELLGREACAPRIWNT